MPEEFEQITARLSARPNLHVRRVGETLRVVPRRSLGGRGPLQLLWPAAEGRVRAGSGAPRASVKPDGWAWVVWMALAGASAVELLMDRAEFPREYPAWAPFALLGAYTVLMILSVFSLSGAIRRVIGR